MKLAEYQDQNPRRPNPSVTCNALYKTARNINCYLTPSQAIQLAQHLLGEAQCLLDNDVTDGTVQLWNQGEASEKLHCGLIEARKGPRRKTTADGSVGNGETSA